MSTSFKSTSGGDGTVEVDALIIGSTSIVAAEIAFLDGVTAGTVTASKAVVVDANKRIDTIVIADGGLNLGTGAGTAVTSTAAELNLIDGSIAGTAVASKAAVLGANKNLDVLVIADGGLSLGAGAGTAITSTAAELNILDGVTATAAELNQYSINVDFADANTAGSIFVVATHAGSIVNMHAVNSVANTTAATVLTSKIAGVTVTQPAWTIAITQAAGTVSSSVPTATNVVTAGQAIEIITDGGGTPVMPTSITIVISR